MAFERAMRGLPSIFWAMVPGFNVYASTKKSETKNKNDSTFSWKTLAHVTNGPYTLTYLGFHDTQPQRRYGGCSVRVTADGNEFSFNVYVDRNNPPNFPEYENFLPFPIIAKSELKIEMRKRGSTSGVSAVTVYATWDRIEAQ